MTTLKLTWSLVLTGALVTAACGDSKSSMLPTAPSAANAAAQSVEADGSEGVSGTMAKGGIPGPPADKGKDKDKDKNGNGNGNGNQPSVPVPPTGSGNVTPPTNTTPPVPSTKTVQLEGLISAKGSNTITVNSQLVSVPSSAVIRHGSKSYKFSDLKIGNRVHVKATRMASTATTATAATTLVASEVKLQNFGDAVEGGDDDDPSASQLVSVVASDATASETGPDSGTFRLTRCGDLTAALTVTFTLTGTATNGDDYELVTLSVTFAAGSATATVPVVPKTDATAEGPETVIITVVDGAGYTAGAPATATVTIAG